MNNQKRILEYITENPWATIREIQKECNISSTSVVHHHLSRLRENGLIACSVPKVIARAKKRKDLLLESLKAIKQELQLAIDEIITWEGN